MFCIDNTGGTLDVTKGQVLAFFTAAEIILPVGFNDATLNFNDSNQYPTASTCSLSLTLPTRYDDYNTFRDKFVYAIDNRGGFGLV